MRQAHTARPARSETSGASYRTSETSAGRARPARSETSGASYRTSETSARRAGTSRQSETSGASCRTSQEPAVPRDCADRSESVIWGGARGMSARGGSQTSGDARYERREGVRGRPKAAGRLTQKLPSPALKGGGAFWILQSRRSEHPYGGNCTERHRARAIAGGAAYAGPCESTRT